MFSKTLLVFLIVNLVSDSCGQRDKKVFRSDYTYIGAEESFYKIHTVPLTWAEAQRVCALEGATFWHPDNDDEAHALISLWDKTKPKIKWMYVGLSDILVEGAFQTVDGKSIAEVYSTWESNEPNNAGGNENCVHIDKEGYMNDADCNRRLIFTCKKSLKLLEWNHKCNMPNLDYTLSKDTGKCYKLHTTPMKWSEANAICQLEQSTLAVIKNRLEADYLVKLTESTPKPRVKGKYQRGIYHLGFHNKLNNGWQTIKEGTPMNVDADAWFDNYQPDGDKECGSMFYTGRLINTDCEMKSFFICEHELDNTTSLASVSLTNSEQAFLHPYVGGGIE